MPSPSPWEAQHAGRRGQPTAVARLGSFWEEKGLPRSSAALCGHQALGLLPGAGSPDRPALARCCARPALEGPELWPPSADTRGNLNAMTSLLSSAAQQEMLSASPSCSEKVGLASPGARRGSAPDLVSGRRAGCSLWVGGGRRPGRGRRGGCTSFAMAHFPSVPGDASVLNRQTGMPSDHWP